MDALHIKYRPSSFDEMYGNEKVISNLEKLVEERKIHVFLFTGQSGCGKTTAARICANMLEVNDLSIMEINSSNNRGIDTARQITDQIKSYPIQGDRWVYIIDECHRTTLDWQNAMLKILEDTPNHVYFFLCTTNPEKLLPALKNRCQIIKFSPLLDKDLSRLLKKINRRENGKANGDVIEKIVYMSYGLARKALVFLEKVINEEPSEALTILKNDEGIDIEDENILNLCRILIDKNKSWNNVCDVLNKLRNESVENIRHGVLGYMRNILLKGKQNNQAAFIMECFIEPFYNSGFDGIVLACYQSLFPN